MTDILMAFILVCGVIPLCLAVQTQIHPWLYGKIKTWLAKTLIGPASA